MRSNIKTETYLNLLDSTSEQLFSDASMGSNQAKTCFEPDGFTFLRISFHSGHINSYGTCTLPFINRLLVRDILLF